MIALALSIAVLALAAYAWWLSKRKVKELTNKVEELTKRLAILKESELQWEHNCVDLNKRLAELMSPHDYKHMPTYSNNGEVRVYKVVTFQERNYRIIIKAFTDADANYNRLRAEELLEKLNEE